MRTIFSFGLLLSVFSIENASGTARMIARAGGEAATASSRVSAPPKGAVQSLREHFERNQLAQNSAILARPQILNPNTKPSPEKPLLPKPTLEKSLDQKPAIPPKKRGLSQIVQEAGLTAKTPQQILRETMEDYEEAVFNDESQEVLDVKKKAFLEAKEKADNDYRKKEYVKNVAADPLAEKQTDNANPIMMAHENTVRQADGHRKMKAPDNAEQRADGHREIVIDYEKIRKKSLLTKLSSNILSLFQRAKHKILP